MPDGASTLGTPTRADDCDDRLRDWPDSFTERFAWLRTVSAIRELAKATRLFAKPSGNGRARGRIALQRLLAQSAPSRLRGSDAAYLGSKRTSTYPEPGAVVNRVGRGLCTSSALSTISRRSPSNR